VVDDYGYECGVVGYIGVGEVGVYMVGGGEGEETKGRRRACLPGVESLGGDGYICTWTAEYVYNAGGSSHYCLFLLFLWIGKSG